MLTATRVFWQTEPRNYYTPRGNLVGGCEPWVVEYDPTGDYRRGAQFTDAQVDAMTTLGTLDEGMVLSRNGRRWRVQDGRVVEETCDFRK